MHLFPGTILGNFKLPLLFFSLQDTSQFYKELPISEYLHLFLTFALSIFFQNLGSILNISTCATGISRGSGNIPVDSNELSTSSVLRLKKPRASFEGERERENFTAGIPAVSVGAAQLMNWARIN